MYQLLYYFHYRPSPYSVDSFCHRNIEEYCRQMLGTTKRRLYADYIYPRVNASLETARSPWQTIVIKRQIAANSCQLSIIDCVALRQQIVESRQRLQQRRQSIVAGRRGSIGSLSSSPPPVNRHGASSPASTPRPSDRTPKSPDVSSSQTCIVQ